MVKYIQLKNGQYLAEHVIIAVGTERDEICVEYIDGGKVSKASAVSAEPCTIESVILALRNRLAEQRE